MAVLPGSAFCSLSPISAQKHARAWKETGRGFGPCGGECHWPVSCHIIYFLTWSLFSVVHIVLWLRRGCFLAAVLAHVVTQTFATLKIRLWINFFSQKALSSLQSIWCGDEQRKNQDQMEITIGEGMREKERKSSSNGNGYLLILYSHFLLLTPPSSVTALRCRTWIHLKRIFLSRLPAYQLRTWQRDEVNLLYEKTKGKKGKRSLSNRSHWIFVCGALW